VNVAPTWIQAISAVAQSLIALATLLLSWVLWRGSKRHARVDYTRTIEDSWNQLNAAILVNPKLAKIADKVFGMPPEEDSDEAGLKRYLAFFSLNVVEACYLGQRNGLVGEAYNFKAICDILDPMLRDPDIAKLLDFGGYHSDFVGFCHKRVSELAGKTLASG
jgi:hypothetical protein